MTFLNISIPHFYCLLRKEFLYNQEKGHGEFIGCAVFGATSIQSRAVMFIVMTERGAQIDRMPLHALAWKKCERQPLDHLELWDAFSYHMSCTQFEYLKGLRCEVLSKNKQWLQGEYLLTFDWAKSAYAEDSGEGGHKSGHLIKLDNGNFAIMPNNRIYWREASFITNPYKSDEERPDFKTNNQNWSCEDGLKWELEDSDRMFYEDKGKIVKTYKV